MNQLHDSTPESWTLFDAACSETITPAELEQLETLLRADDRACDCYLAYVRMHAELFRLKELECSRREIMRAIRHANTATFPGGAAVDDASRSAPSAFPVVGVLDSEAHGTVGYLASGWPLAYLIATIVMAVGVLVGSLVRVSEPVQVASQSVALPSPVSPLPSVVGRITGTVDCKWAGTAFDSPAVPLGRKYELASGLMEIAYDTGAKVILQGPVTYVVESKDGGFLSLGKLTAKLDKRDARFNREPTASASAAEISKSPNLQTSKSAIPHPSSLIPHPLFSVRTPTAIVTDLGTEFGVEVSKEGYTTSHVFRGAVRLCVASPDGKPKSDARVLRTNESARVERSGGSRALVFVPIRTPSNFVRQIPKRITKVLDLVDVVAGGDGFGRARHRGINPNTGEIVDRPPPEGPGWERVRSDGQYHRVKGMPFVDGVFVPDDHRGPIQLDSAGHTFTDFGTSDDRVFGCIWAGAPIPSPLPPPIRTELGGVDYASHDHAVLGMVPNKGITFDLEAIRRANPGLRILWFCAVAGNTEPKSEKGQSVRADVRVFVDGQVRFQRGGINRHSGPQPIAVSLREHDRFLTLVASDGGDKIAYDWVVFGDPRLEVMSPTETPSMRQEAWEGRGHVSGVTVRVD